MRSSHNLNVLLLALACVASFLTTNSFAVDLPTPKASTAEQFSEFVNLCAGEWVSNGVFINDWPGQTKKAGEAFTGHTSFRWTKGKQGLVEDESIGQTGVTRLYRWDPQSKLIESHGVTSLGIHWTTTFWKEGNQWKWRHQEASETQAETLVGYGDCAFESDRKHARRGTLWAGGRKLLPYNDVYRRTSVRIADFAPKLGRFEGKCHLFTDFGESSAGDEVTWIQDRAMTQGGNVLEVKNYVVADGKTTLASVELHRFDEQLNTTTFVASSPEGVFQGTWRRKPDDTNTLVLDWSWGAAKGTTLVFDISENEHKIQFENIVSPLGRIAATEIVNMRRVDISPQRIAQVQETVDYFLGDWSVTRNVDGKIEHGSMKVERAPNGHGHLVTQTWTSGNISALFGFDTASGRWTGQWQHQNAGVVGSEVWPDLKPGPLQAGDRYVSRQSAMIDGQRGLETWTYEIKSSDRFDCNSSNVTLAGKPQPETRMEFTRKR